MKRVFLLLCGCLMMFFCIAMCMSGDIIEREFARLPKMMAPPPLDVANRLIHESDQMLVRMDRVVRRASETQLSELSRRIDVHMEGLNTQYESLSGWVYQRPGGTPGRNERVEAISRIQELIETFEKWQGTIASRRWFLFGREVERIEKAVDRLEVGVDKVLLSKGFFRKLRMNSLRRRITSLLTEVQKNIVTCDGFVGQKGVNENVRQDIKRSLVSLKSRLMTMRDNLRDEPVRERVPVEVKERAFEIALPEKVRPSPILELRRLRKQLLEQPASPVRPAWPTREAPEPPEEELLPPELIKGVEPEVAIAPEAPALRMLPAREAPPEPEEVHEPISDLRARAAFLINGSERYTTVPSDLKKDIEEALTGRGPKWWFSRKKKLGTCRTRLNEIMLPAKRYKRDVNKFLSDHPELDDESRRGLSDQLGSLNSVITELENLRDRIDQRLGTERRPRGPYRRL